MRDVSQDWPILADHSVSVPATTGRLARTARVVLRAGRARLPRPGSAGAGTPAVLELGLVRVDEVDGPSEEGLSWHLLTTLPVATAARAADVVRLYRLRWRIEDVFRALKSDGRRRRCGCRKSCSGSACWRRGRCASCNSWMPAMAVVGR